MARVHQILALKSLGLTLRRIADLLAATRVDLDAVLRLQKAAFSARTAGDQRRLRLLARIRRRLAEGESLSVADLIHRTQETVMGITKTHDAFRFEEEAMAVIKAAGYHPLTIDVPAARNEDHWHDFDSIIFILKGEFVMTEAATGQTHACGPGTRIDFPPGRDPPRGSSRLSRADRLLGRSRALTFPIDLPPETWAG